MKSSVEAGGVKRVEITFQPPSIIMVNAKCMCNDRGFLQRRLCTYHETSQIFYPILPQKEVGPHIVQIAGMQYVT